MKEEFLRWLNGLSHLECLVVIPTLLRSGKLMPVHGCLPSFFQFCMAA
jgi:hypothetical protein